MTEGIPCGSLAKNWPANAMQEVGVQSLGQEDPLEKKMATHPSILAWEIPWAEEPDWLQSVGLQRVRQDSAHMQAGNTKASDTGRFNREELELFQRISNLSM